MRQVPIDKGQPRSEGHKEGVDTHEQVTVLDVRVELHKEKVRGDFTGASVCHEVTGEARWGGLCQGIVSSH